MKLRIREEVYQKVMHWVNTASFEVSGFGIIKMVEDIPTVVDAILIEQEGSAAETEMKADAIAKAEYVLRNADGEMRWWWHSHVNMAVFWSGTDTATIKQLGKQGWFFHTVFNKKYEMKTAFSAPRTIHSPFHEPSDVFIVDDLPVEFTYNIRPDIIAQWDKAFQENVKQRKYSNPYMEDGSYWKYGFKVLKDGTICDYDAQTFRYEPVTDPRSLNKHQLANYERLLSEIEKEAKEPKETKGQAQIGMAIGYTKEDVIKDIEEMFWSNASAAEISSIYYDDIRRFKLDINQMRARWTSSIHEEYGGMYGD